MAVFKVPSSPVARVVSVVIAAFRLVTSVPMAEPMAVSRAVASAVSAAFKVLSTPVAMDQCT
jgi:hypothetical protein